MTTPSPSTVEVLGVLVDPVILCHQTVPSSETIDAMVDSLWKTMKERVENSTSEILKPSVIQVVLGES